MLNLKTGLGLLLGSLLLTAPASALSLGSFTCITNNSASNCAIGEAQLSADLTGNILTITMSGAAAAVVEQVFIAGSAVAGEFAGSAAGGLVSFSDSVAGGNLPGGNSIGFTEVFNFAARNPAPRFGIGVHPQDSAPVQAAQFALKGDLSKLQVGVHVIGFRNGGSESFVTGGPLIPEPSSALLFGIGGLAVAAWVRRSR